MNTTSKELQLAYEQTHYIVIWDEGEWILQIGVVNPQFNQWLLENKIQTWAFITAYNPFSEALSEKENTKLQSQLERILIKNNYQLWNGRGQGVGNWPAEESFFIANISQELAGKLATDFKQNAYVFGSYNSKPQLIFC